MTRQISSYPEMLSSWEIMIKAVSANPEDAPHLQEQFGQLTAFLEQARSIVAEQAAVTARRQDLSKQLRETISAGNKLATLVRHGLKNRYGNDSEKLVEFGIQPLRRRIRPVKAKSTGDAAPSAPPSSIPPIPTE
jgi:hypothetical protein